ncbi:hypothetical protein AMAG_20764 [Allomyces macrogynus ATCC 38327]|uniref:Uncharacterized protein n=1 Tax=Allomyces macrogynus (strain ATCC 38327) TaxID=578462 RepID=A0A0L0TF50_ALLM3|nr:hypothetical protein AMAG_20764 [Allomyces macrogynus ATCC 38327]|eukprot:KNE73325.1 hypothetical protein AMAG_20764 [Allomyces macrogynus ATCC 38327]
MLAALLLLLARLVAVADLVAAMLVADRLDWPFVAVADAVLLSAIRVTALLVPGARRAAAQVCAASAVYAVGKASILLAQPAPMGDAVVAIAVAAIAVPVAEACLLAMHVYWNDRAMQDRDDVESRTASPATTPSPPPPPRGAPPGARGPVAQKFARRFLAGTAGARLCAASAVYAVGKASILLAQPAPMGDAVVAIAVAAIAVPVAEACLLAMHVYWNDRAMQDRDDVESRTASPATTPSPPPPPRGAPPRRTSAVVPDTRAPLLHGTAVCAASAVYAVGKASILLAQPAPMGDAVVAIAVAAIAVPVAEACLLAMHVYWNDRAMQDRDDVESRTASPATTPSPPPPPRGAPPRRTSAVVPDTRAPLLHGTAGAQTYQSFHAPDASPPPPLPPPRRRPSGPRSPALNRWSIATFDRDSLNAYLAAAASGVAPPPPPRIQAPAPPRFLMHAVRSSLDARSRHRMDEDLDELTTDDMSADEEVGRAVAARGRRTKGV